MRNTGTLTLVDCVVSNSSGGYGGGMYNSKSLTLTRTVVSGNTALISYAAGSGLTNDGGTVMATQTAFRNNHAGSNGGGIFNFPGVGGSLTLEGCELSGNMSNGGGGGLEGNNFSVSTLINTTVSGNMSQSSGAGILVYDSAVLNLNNVTITGNMGSLGNAGSGGGISSNTGIIGMKNTILAGNTGGSSPDCSMAPSDLTSQGYNLIGDATNCTGVGAGTNDIIGVNAHLDVLALNANANGPTRTHALLAGSPAIDGGNPGTPGSGGNTCATTDQRGVSRTPAGALPCDIGAYEALPKPTTTTTTSTSSSSAMPTTTNTTTSSSSSSSTSSSSSLVPTTSTTVHVTTSSSTTAAPSSTTTTMTLPGCGGNSPATFASVECQLDALLARIAGEPGLGSFAPKLTQSVQTGKTRTADAAGTCRDGKLKKAKKRLQQATKGLTQYVHRLSGLAARKRLDSILRQSFIDDGSLIKQELGTLRNDVHCPDDAPPG